jgi:hypothetical protein
MCRSVVPRVDLSPAWPPRRKARLRTDQAGNVTFTTNGDRLPDLALAVPQRGYPAPTLQPL